MHAPARVEENTPVGSDRRRALEQIVEDRQTALARMRALDRLTELHLVADENDVLRGGAHCDEVSERHLAGFVDEEIIEILVELGHSE